MKRLLMWKQNFQIKRHTSSINSIDVSPDLTLLATGSSDRSVGLTNLQTKKTQYLRGHQDNIKCVSFSPNAMQLASSSNDGTTILWNSKTTENVGILKGHQLTVRSICWSPNGRSIVTGSNDKTAVVWSLNHFTKRQVLTGLKGWVRDVKWHQNTIAVAGNDNRILLFDTRVPKHFQSIPTGTTADITSISFHNSSQCIAGGSFDQMIRIWDLRTSTLLQRHAAHTAPITKVAFNPFNDTLLSVGNDCFARLWDLKAASIMATFSHHDAPILSCCWYPSGKGFVTTGEDRKICSFRSEDDPIDPMSLEFDGGDIVQAIDRMRRQLVALASTMKSLDKRLLLQEEKLQWLSDIE